MLSFAPGKWVGLKGKQAGAAVMAEGLTEEERADRAREFRVNLNRQRPSRKRYSLSSRFLQASALEQSQSDLESNVSAFSTSTALQSDLAPLQALGGEAIYREIDEKESVSKWRNALANACPQPMRNALLPPRGWDQWKKFVFLHLPVLHWLWTYRPKQLIGDFIAGITIGVTHIPQGIGFALLASLSPVYGLYSSFIPVILYSIFGSSRHISVGTFPVVALMVGNAITRITMDYEFCSMDDTSSNGTTNGTISDNSNYSTSDDPCAMSQCEDLRVDIAIDLSLLVGIFMTAMGLLKLGFITLFLSDALVSGYTAAAAFTIFVTQIRFLFGLDAEDAAIEPGYFTTPRRVIKYLELIFTGQVNGAAIVTAVISIIILLSTDQINGIFRKYIRKIPVHIPAQLLVVILTTVISYGARLSDRFQLPVISDVGGIPPGECFGITVPKGSLIPDLIGDAIIISVISFVINISQAKLLAKKNSYTVSPDQELFAYGIMNFGGAFFGSFPTAGALSRTILQDATGGNTQLVGFISSGIVILVILFLGSLFGPLPNAALAAIVVVALKGLYFQVRDIYKFYRLSRQDMLVWLAVFLATLFIGLDIGLGIGVLFSLLLVVVRTIIPFSPELGETRAWHYPPEEKFADEDFDVEDLKVYRVHQIYIFQFNAPIYFANVAVFRERLSIETGIKPSDLDGSQGCFQKCCTAKAKVKDPQQDLSDDVSYVKFDDEDSDIQSLVNSTSSGRFHTVIIDCAPIGFVDSMGVAMIEQVVREYDRCDVQILLAAPTTLICKSLRKTGFFKRFSSERLFPSVASAVRYARDGNRVPALEQSEEPDITLASNLERQLLYSARPSLLDTKPIELESRTRSPTVAPPGVVESTETKL